MEKEQKDIIVTTPELNSDNPETFFRGMINEYTEGLNRSIDRIYYVDQYKNVAIFVDYDNVYWTLMNNYNHDPNNEDLNKNLIYKLWEKYGSDHVRTFRVYADFEKIKSNLTSLQKQRVQIRHVYSNDKDGDRRKNSSDIELCIDAIENTYKDPSVSCYVFVTADSDMVPIMSRLMYKGKRVELFYLSDAAPKHTDITNYCHYSEDLLNFVNVEKEEVNPELYWEETIKFIMDWENRFKDNDNYYLGAPYIRDKVSNKLNFPPKIASVVIEQLEVEGFITTINKDFKGSKKQSYTVTEKGKSKFVFSVDEVAASSSSK